MATDPTNGGRFVNVTSSPSVTITSNSPNDVFRHFTNGGTLTSRPDVNSTAASPAVSLDGFLIQSIGAITVGFTSRIKLSNFQSTGTLTLTAGFTHQADSELDQPRDRPLCLRRGQSYVRRDPGRWEPSKTLVDLHGQNAIVVGGLFVNNGFVGTFGAVGPTIIADYGALGQRGRHVRRARSSPRTAAGSRPGNSPGCGLVWLAGARPRRDRQLRAGHQRRHRHRRAEPGCQRPCQRLGR